MSHCRPLALALAMIMLGAWVCTASASDGHDAPLAQASKKKSCKKGAKSATALYGAQTAKKKKKCKKPVGDPVKTPLSAAISSCPTGSVSGSNVATVSGTAAVGPGIVTYVHYNQVDPSGYFDTLIGQEVRVFPSASGAWSHSFTPGFPESWVATDSWEEVFVVANSRAHDGVTARCSWTVIR